MWMWIAREGCSGVVMGTKLGLRRDVLRYLYLAVTARLRQLAAATNEPECLEVTAPHLLCVVGDTVTRGLSWRLIVREQAEKVREQTRSRRCGSEDLNGNSLDGC